MKAKCLSFILFVFTFNIFGQNNVENTITISVRDFDLQTIKTTNGQSEKGHITLKLQATYDKQKNNVLVVTRNNASDVTDSSIVSLDYPLNFEYFSTKFRGKIGEKNDLNVPVYESVLEVFYWIVAITDKLKPDVLSGELILQQGLLTYDNDHEPLYEQREENKARVIADRDKAKGMLDERYQEELDVLIVNKKAVKGPYVWDEVPMIDLRNRNKKLFEEKKKEVLKMGDGHQDFILNDRYSAEPVIKDSNSEYSRYNSFAEIKSGSMISVPNSDDLFYYIIRNEHNYKLLSNDNLKLYEDSLIKYENEVIKQGYYQIEKVKFHFEKGFLERIQVYVKYGEDQKTQIFENLYPIGFTSISNYKHFKNIRLYIRNANKDDKHDRHIFLSDVIQNYDNELDLATKDYSPADTAFTVVPSANPVVKLFKQKSIYIIEGKTFTDVSGLNEKSPNGLVQLELSRRFNLKSNRTQLGSNKNIGWFTYTVARVNFSKIEEKQKNLLLRNEKLFENDVLISPSYATNMDFLRYESLSIRLETNLLLYDYPEDKFTFYADLGLKYGHTPVSDSTYAMDTIGSIVATGRELDAYHFTAYPKIWVEVFAERRYGFSLSYQLNYTILFSNNNYKQVLSYSGKGNDLSTLPLNKAARFSHTVELRARFDSSPTEGTGKIFAAARFNFQNKDINTFYPQILIGYAFNIFK
jgi:hypothetical protein